jgi:hypothetical protein
MNTTKTNRLEKLAGRLANCFEVKTRDDGNAFYCIKDNESFFGIRALVIVQGAHNNSKILPNDLVYKQVYQTLEQIEADGCLEVYDADIEPDIYNHDLKKWSLENFADDYIDEALESFGAESYIDALSMGNQLWKQDIYRVVYNCLESYL